MKCTFCGNNVPDGSELCPECGMILSLDGGDEGEISVPAYTPNVFGSEPIKVPEPPHEAEEDAFESEISVPEYNPDEINTDTEPENTEAVLTEAVIDNADVSETATQEPEYIGEDNEAQDIYEAPEYESDLYEAEEEPTVIYEAPAYGDAEIDAAYSAPAEPTADTQQDEAEENEYESFASENDEKTPADESFAAYEEQDDTVKITPVIVPVEDTASEAPAAEETEELEDAEDDDDTYIKSGKKGRTATVAALCLLLICLVVAGGYIVKKVLPGDGTTTTQPAAPVIATGTDATTEPTANEQETTEAEQTTEPSVTDDTTEADTTAPDVTVPSEEPTTEPTTEPVTEPSSEPTTKPTTEPSTRPSTKPSTKPSTTVDPYGINGNAEIKKPSSYLSESYIGYTNRKVDMLGGPSSSSDWVQALGKGGEVKVLAQQSGYSYVYSTRFGTYGWIKSSYISDSRPVESTTSVSKDTVRPDKNGSGELMCTTYSLNMRTGPGKDYDSIKIIPVNYQVKIIGYKSGVSDWAYVTDLVSGKNGWVSTAYLTQAE